jgi:hypothetical protein
MKAAWRVVLSAATLMAFAGLASAEERQTTGPGAEKQEKTESTSSSSDQPATQGPSMRSLLDDGYTILQATFVPHDAVKRAGSTVDVDAMMFLLTKGTQVATCYTDLQSYTDGSFVTLACNEYK